MPRLYVCPCCGGQGLVHDLRGDEDRILECMECEATGRVTLRHRQELLDWRHVCRLRPLQAAAAPAARNGGRKGRG